MLGRLESATTLDEVKAAARGLLEWSSRRTMAGVPDSLVMELQRIDRYAHPVAQLLEQSMIELTNRRIATELSADQPDIATTTYLLTRLGVASAAKHGRENRFRFMSPTIDAAAVRTWVRSYFR